MDMCMFAFAVLASHVIGSGPLFSKGRIISFGVVSAIFLIYWLFKGRNSN
jgi:hypothetical protein